MLRRLFIDHPASVGETYGEHLVVASSFGWRMIWAGFACLIHGLVPGLCRTTGSRMIAELHECMVTHRRRTDAETPAHASDSAVAPAHALPATAREPVEPLRRFG